MVIVIVCKTIARKCKPGSIPGGVRKKMRIRKSHPILSIVNGMLIDLPTPSNISYWWGFGSLLGLCLIIQLLSGIFLAMHYTANIDLAFVSVEHIMRDVNYGWLLRYIHANGASMFFILVYLHVARGLYYGGFNKPRDMVWNIGVIILIVMMATAFIGYVLPWGQMSFWGATVITNLISAIPYIGNDIVQWIWGGFSVSNATLNRFYSFHYLLPFVLAGLAMVHLIALHEHGSNNPIGIDSNIDKVPFHPYYSIKDLFGYAVFAIFFTFIVYFYPNTLGRGWPFVLKKYRTIAMCYMLGTYNNYNNTFILSDSKNNANPNKVKIYYNLCNQPITKLIYNINKLKVGISETTRTQKIILNSYSTFCSNFKNDSKFNEWLGGLIDGDGSFGITEKKFTYCEIIVGIEDEKLLRQIQNKFGGSIKKRSGLNAIRYRLNNQMGMENLLNQINGNIRQSKRLVQLHKVASLFNIEVLIPKKLTIDNAWFMGFFDAKGTINYYYQNGKPQLIISVVNKYLQDIEEYKNILGGNIYFSKGINGHFKWIITNEENHKRWFEYNKNNPSRSFKGCRIFWIKDFYELYNSNAYLKDEEKILLNQTWLEFEQKWQKRIRSA